MATDPAATSPMAMEPKVGPHGADGIARPLPGELDEHAADAAAHADRHLGDDRADDGVRRGEPQGGQQVRHGGREPQPQQRRASSRRRSERIRSRWMRSGASSPRSAPTATGKNARYEAMIATESHCGHGGPPRAICVPMRVDDRGEGDQRHGLADHDPGQQTPLGETPALHDDAEQHPDRDADDPADRRDPEGQGGGADDRDDQRRGVAAARRLEQPGEHLPDVRHRAVVGARQEQQPEPVSPAVAPTSKPSAGPRTCSASQIAATSEDAERRPSDSRQPRRGRATRGSRGRVGGRHPVYAFAVRWSLSAGMTVSP